MVSIVNRVEYAAVIIVAIIIIRDGIIFLLSLSISSITRSLE